MHHYEERPRPDGNVDVYGICDDHPDCQCHGAWLVVEDVPPSDPPEPPETWPTPKYVAMLLPKGMIKTGEFLDPRGYKGSGTHFLCCDGGAVILQTPVVPDLSLYDPRRYILLVAERES